LQRNRKIYRQRGNKPVESSSENKLCGSFDESHTNFNELACHYQEQKQDVFLELDFPFPQEKWILVAFATRKIKNHYIGVSVIKGGPTVNFIRRVKNSFIFIWAQRDDIYEIETGDIVAFIPTS
jgi:hypothetical protein